MNDLRPTVAHGPPQPHSLVCQPFLPFYFPQSSSSVKRYDSCPTHKSHSPARLLTLLTSTVSGGKIKLQEAPYTCTLRDQHTTSFSNKQRRCDDIITTKSADHLPRTGAPDAMRSFGSVADPLDGESTPRGRISCLINTTDHLGYPTDTKPRLSAGYQPR